MYAKIIRGFLAELCLERELEINDAQILRSLQQRGGPASVWLKGNLHTHTNASDGDSPPLEVARWYADNGYDFLVITDHNVRVSTWELQRVLDNEGRRILLIPGEELTAWWTGPGWTHALHVGGIDTVTTLGPADGNTIAAALQTMIDRVLENGGVPSLNHPNFWDSVSADDILQLERLSHFEIFNGHPAAANSGSDRLPPLEVTWDLLLTRGKRMFGLAVDDAHDFLVWGEEHRNPGRGWVSVESSSRHVGPVMDAIAQGRFFASTGPSFNLVQEAMGRLRVEASISGLIEFISGGRVVEALQGEAGSCPVPARGYVRARVSNHRGMAWSQPAFG
ncbi:MAG TPA: CehA/McbA family metallohydrolase [Acidimicrobiia bacterium]|nr:CehA/McbA family metallohydrolase [Acidimicrobiia bacterium]